MSITLFDELSHPILIESLAKNAKNSELNNSWTLYHSIKKVFIS